MTNTVADLRRKIEGAGDLQSVVRTMKAVAASSVGQYEHSVSALADYYRTVELGLSVCFRSIGPTTLLPEPSQEADERLISGVVFGTDQGLVGRFNDVVAAHAVKTLRNRPGAAQLWAVGERVEQRLADAGLPLLGLFPVPTSVQAITPLIGRILTEHHARHGQDESTEFYLFYNRPESRSVYAPASRRLLPLDATWHSQLMLRNWPTKNLPQVAGANSATLRAFVHEYLFVSLFRACAESLASENASRLAAMQRADKNIEELLSDLNSSFHRLRQNSIDSELFDLISAFEALAGQQ